MRRQRFEPDDSCRHIGRDQTHRSVSAHRQDVPRKGRASTDSVRIDARALAERVASEAGCEWRRLRLLGRHLRGFFICHGWRGARTFVLRESSARVGHHCSRALPILPPYSLIKCGPISGDRSKVCTFRKASAFQKASAYHKASQTDQRVGCQIRQVLRITAPPSSGSSGLPNKAGSPNHRSTVRWFEWVAK